MTMLTAAVLGGLAALLAWPLLRDRQLLDRLGNHDPEIRQRAASVLLSRARDSARLRGWIADELDTDSDKAFGLIVGILGELAVDHADARRALAGALSVEDDRRFLLVARALQSKDLLVRQADAGALGRWLLLRLPPPDSEMSADPAVLRAILNQALLQAGPSRYLETLAERAAESALPEIRVLAAALAARLGLDETLAALLEDPDPLVAGDAALAAGYAGRRQLTGPLGELLAESDNVEIASSAAWALALLQGPEAGPAVGKRLAGTDDDALADRLVWVLTRADTPAGRAEITRRMLEGDLPRAATIHAAGRLGLVQVADRVETVLAEATRPGSGVSEPQLLAALIAAGQLGLDARDQTRQILDTLWAPQLNWAMFLAVEHLGRQVRLRPEAEASETCIETLRTAARYESAAAPGATAVPSAAAAAELWLLGPQPSWYRLEPPADQADRPEIEAYAFDTDAPAWWVQHLAGADNSLAGDVLAWKLGGSGRAEARQLARRMLAGPMAVRNNNRLGAAAMMLALAVRAEGLGADQADRIIRSRLYTRFGMVEDYNLRSSYQAALAVLGDREAAENVRRLFELGVGPTRRIFTALLLAGDKTAVDWVLLSGILDPEELVNFFLNRAAGRVMHAIAGDVPLPQLPADPAQRAWQVRMLRQFWLQHRHRLELRWPR